MVEHIVFWHHRWAFATHGVNVQGDGVVCVENVVGHGAMYPGIKISQVCAV